MGKRLLFLIPVLIVLAVFQTSVFPHMLILDVIPDLVLVFVCVLSYFRGSSEGLIFGLIGGLLLDLMIGRTIGFYALFFMLLCFLIGFFPRNNFWENSFVTMIITMAIILGLIVPFDLILYWMKKISVFFAMGMRGSSIETGVALQTLIFPKLLYNSIVFIPVYLICRKIDKVWNKRRKLLDGL